jgi:hypothetical protein
MGTWFPAKRDGRCSHCPNPIAKGDDIYAKSAGVFLCQGCGLLAENAPRVVGDFEGAVLAELAKLPPEAAEGTYAQNMLGLARDLDAGDVPPRERPQYTKEIRLNLLALQDAYPQQDEDDETEAARRKRERRAREGGGF